MRAEVYVQYSLPTDAASGTACMSFSPIGWAFAVRQKIDIDRTAPSGSYLAILHSTAFANDPAGCAGRGGTVARSSGTWVVFDWSSTGSLQPPMMRTSTSVRDVAGTRAEEDEQAFAGSFSRKTPPKKTTVSDWRNHYTFRSVLAAVVQVDG